MNLPKCALERGIEHQYHLRRLRKGRQLFNINFVIDNGNIFIFYYQLFQNRAKQSKWKTTFTDAKGRVKISTLPQLWVTSTFFHICTCIAGNRGKYDVTNVGTISSVKVRPIRVTIPNVYVAKITAWINHSVSYFFLYASFSYIISSLS